MQLQVLGVVEVNVDGTSVVELRPQTRRLIAMLAIADGTSVPAERIAEHVMGGNPDKAALRKAVSRVRAVLGERVERSQGGYLLRADVTEVDARRFESMCRAARNATPDERVDILTSALELWRGNALHEFADEPWAAPTAARLERTRATAKEDLAEALIVTGQAADAIDVLVDHLTAAPYEERPVELMMRALAASGRVTDALRCYQRFRQRLRDDIGVTPSAALARLELELITDGDAAEADQRAPAQRRAPSTNLAHPLAAIIGRSEELESIGRGVASHRLTTITGMGGVGKTRLATEIGWAAMDRGPEAVWFIDLVPVGDESTIVHAVASVVGARGEADAPLIDSVIHELRQRHVVLIFDNCEHVRRASADVISAIVANCPEVRVLATSREPLGVPGERVHPIGPLTEGEGVELFCAHAADAAGSSGAFLDARMPEISEICRQLDGVPLAIELAAARARSFTPAEILARLDDRFHLVTGAEGRPPRHRTMRDVIGWSYQLLSLPERSLFDRISIFSGGFDVAAAEAVCCIGDDAPDDVAEGLASLVDKSMIVAGRSSAGTRFHVLSTLRQFGRDRLDERVAADGTPEVSLVRRHHVDHYAAVAASVASMYTEGDQEAAVALLTLEWDNSRDAVFAAIDDGDVDAAVRTVFGLYPAMITFQAEHADWVRAVFPLAVPPSPAANMLCNFAAQWAMALGDPTEAVALVQRGQQWWPDDPYIANVLAQALTQLDRPAEAMDAARISLAWVARRRAQRVGRDIHAANFTSTACRCALTACPEETVELARLSADIAREVGGPDASARAQFTAGLAHLATGHHTDALAAFQRGLEVARGLGGRRARRGTESSARQRWPTWPTPMPCSSRP